MSANGTSPVSESLGALSLVKGEEIRWQLFSTPNNLAANVIYLHVYIALQFLVVMRLKEALVIGYLVSDSPLPQPAPGRASPSGQRWKGDGGNYKADLSSRSSNNTRRWSTISYRSQSSPFESTRSSTITIPWNTFEVNLGSSAILF